MNGSITKERRLANERRTTLENTVNSKSCVNIESKQMGLLRKQLEAMLQYEEILFTRIIDLMK